MKNDNQDELFNSVFPNIPSKTQEVIISLKKQYLFLNFDEKEFNQIVEQQMSIAKNFCKDNKKIDFSETLKKLLIEQFNKIIQEKMKDANSIDFINSYINNRLKIDKDNNLRIKELIKLGKFLDKYNYFLDVDDCISLVQSNEALNTLLTRIVKDNLVLIKSGKINLLFEDDIVKALVQTYCMVNNVKTEENIESENYIDLSEEFRVDHPYIENSVQAYLSEIQMPLLTKEEEREIALKIASGDNEAKKIMIERNLRMVVKIAYKYLNRGLSLLDLIQEGNIGLMKAVDKYDLEKGFRFSTYATSWVTQSIIIAIANKGKTIRIPVHMQEKIIKYKKTKDVLETKLNRIPTLKEIAKAMGISLEKATEIYYSLFDTVSLNSIVSDEDDRELENFISDKVEVTEDIVEKNISPSVIKELFRKCNLTHREIEVLSLRYGLNDGVPRTLEEIGKLLGNISRERARQIEARTIKKIRQSDCLMSYAAYMDDPNMALQTIEYFRKEYATGYRSEYKKMIKGSDLVGNNDHKGEGIEKNGRKLQNIYSLLKPYSKEQIDIMLLNLTNDERQLIKFRYGNDLTNPVTPCEWTKKLSSRFYTSLVPKMKKMLASSNAKIMDQIDKKKVREQQVKMSTSNAFQDEKNNDKMQRADYEMFLEILKAPSFGQLVSEMSVKEAVIVSLKLGYFDGKAFSTEEIASFLEIEPNEVIKTTRKVLLVYKEQVYQLIDKTIEDTISKSTTYQKK